MPLRGLVLLLFFLASVPFCFFVPFYGIILWVIVAFLNPQSYSWAAEMFPWAAAVAVPTMLGMLVFDRNFGRLASRQVYLIGLLWFWFTVTTFISMRDPVFVHHAQDTFEKWWFVSKVLLMTLCTIPIVSSFQRLRYLVLTIAACFGFYVLKSLPFVIITGGVHRLYGPDRSMIADNNDFGLALNMTLPLYFFLAQTEQKRWMKAFIAFLFVITIPAIFFTYSRGALVGLAAVGLLMFLQTKRRFMLVPVVALGFVIAVYFAPETWKDRMNPSRPNVVDSSAQSRLNAWAFARALAADHPVVGGGFGTFTTELYEQYAPTRSAEIYGPHSVYFQVMAEHGYVGLTLYLLLVVSCLLSTRRLRKKAKAHKDKEIANYAQMFQLSLMAFLISGSFLGRAYFDYYFTLVACISILERVASERWAANLVSAGVAETSAAPSVPPADTYGWRPRPASAATRV